MSTRNLDLALAGSKGVKVLPDLTSKLPSVGDVMSVASVTGGDVVTVFGPPGALGSSYLSTTGGTMTGPIVLAADPATNMQAATRQYVDGVKFPEAPTDGLFYARQNTTWRPVLPLSGSTMSGPLILAADPTVPLGAATMQYVQAQIAAGPFLPLATGGTVAGATTFSAGGMALNVTNSATIGNTLNTAAFNASSTSTFGSVGNKQIQLIGGAVQAFINSLGGPLTLQTPAGYNVNVNPGGTTGTSLTLNGAFNQNLFFNGIPPVVGVNVVGAGFTMTTDSAVVTPSQGVLWVSVGGNVGAVPWAPSTAVAVNNIRNNGGNLYICTTAGTTASSGGPTGTGTGITDGTVVWNYQASDYVGIRSALSASYLVRSPPGPAATAQQKQYPASQSTFNGSANQGGTALLNGAAYGIGYAGGDQAWLSSGATYWQALVGREIDAGIYTGASALSRTNLTLVSYGNVQGTLGDSAIGFGSTGNGGSSFIPWNTILALGEGAAQASGTTAILAYKPRPPGALAGNTYGNPGAALGIDLANIVFSTAAFRAPGGAGFDGTGAVFSGAAKLSTTASAVALDAVGYIVTAVPSVDTSAPAPAGFKVGDQVYELDGNGTIITINTVNGSGWPLTWTLTVAGGTLASPPSNPVTFYGGSGSASARFNLTWTRVNTLSLNPSGGSTTFGGPVAFPTNFSGAAATTRSVFLQSGASNRWAFTLDSLVEGGSNAGSNLSIGRYDDTGTTLLGSPISINRANGMVTFASGLTSPVGMTASGTVSVQLLGGAGQGFVNGVSGPLTLQSGTNANINLTPGGTGQMISNGPSRFNSTVGFNNTAPIAKPTISGACAGNTAIKALLAALASYGLVTDSTTA